MHFSVLIIGDDPELQLDRYWELDLDEEELVQDPRAEFLITFPAAALPALARRFIDEVAPSDPERAARYRRLLKEDRLPELLSEHYGGQLGPEGDWGYYVNPEGKWDWCLLGGRAQGALALLPGKSGTVGERSWTNPNAPDDPTACDQAHFADIDWPRTRARFTPYAVLKDGEWHDQGEAGQFDSSDAAADAAWEAEVDRLLAGLPPETVISVYDCHI
jgi:hypothetical protein